NTRFWPSVPWSVVPWAAYLWVFGHYLDGRWWPRSTSGWRRRCLRAYGLPPRIWRWALLAGGLSLAAYAALDLVLVRLLPFQPGTGIPDAVLRIPRVTLGTMLVMVAAVAGMVEEAAFRGYMQGPIERRHGPVAALVLVSVIFSLLHLAPPAPGWDRGASAVVI